MFSQKYLKEKLKTYVNGNGRVVIFAEEQEKTALEKILLETSAAGAFFHVQVISCKTYLLNLFHKNHLFSYQPLSKATALMAVKASLEMSGLHYFKGLTVDAGLLETLLSAYEMMADIDLDMPVKRSGISREKWDELILMYRQFQKVKKNELFDCEIDRMAIPYLEKDVTYVSFSHAPYTRSREMLLEACHAVLLDEAGEAELSTYEKALDASYHQLQSGVIADFPVNLYEVQFSHQEIDLVIAEIEKHLKAGWRYQDMVVYVPDTGMLESFIRRCPYPCRYTALQTNTYELAFLDHLWQYFNTPDAENRSQLADLARLEDAVFDGWLADFEKGTTTKRLTLLEEMVSPSLLEDAHQLPEDLSLADFVLFVPLLITTSSKEASDALDRIEICQYHSPQLARHFKEAFLCGLNEDIYPSKISDKGLILNEELQAYYPWGTPLDHQNEEEWALVKKILVSADHCTVSCHYGSLDGTDCLPSLLFNHLKDLKGIKKAPNYPLPFMAVQSDEILERLEASAYQPEALAEAFAGKLYLKKGKMQISPSELESFNQCPFKHFMNYGLKLYPKKSSLETRTRFGNLMHDLLDQCSVLFNHDFMHHLAALERKFQILPDEQATLDERLSQLVSWMIARENFNCEQAEDKYLLSQFQPQFLNTLKMLLYHVQEGKFDLTYHELPVALSSDNVTYVGRIDRADVYGDYLKILDYKSSGKQLDLALCIQGFNIQMLVYLEILSRQKHLKKGAALYFNTSPRKLEANGKMNLDGTCSDDFVKSYQMEGYLLEDDLHQVMYGLDQNFVESKICHIRYVKSRDEYSGKLLKEDQWEHLITLIFKRMHAIVDDCFYRGDIRIYPAGSQESALRMKVSPCRYCDYADVCLKDAFYHEEREIRQYTKEELDRLLEGGDLDEPSRSI